MSGRDVLSPAVMIPTAIVAVMAGVAAIGFRGVFPDWTFVSAAAIGAVGAALVMLLARWARLVVGEALLLSLVAFVLLGAVAAEGVPTPDAFGTFFDGLVRGWARVLSSTPPADLTPQFRVLPYTVAWFGSMVGVELVRSSKVPGLPAMGPVLALGFSLLVTLEDRTVAIFQGAFLVVGAVLLGAVQQRLRVGERHEGEITVGSSTRSAGLTAAGLSLALVAAAAPILGPRLPLADANDRFDLRRYQTPPFDPLAEPSPLVQLKASLVKEVEDVVVFRVTADEQLRRFPVAVHRTYDGVVWAVADERGDAPGEFRPVDSVFPEPSIGQIDEWDVVTAEIEIVDYPSVAAGRVSTVWLPSTGWPIGLGSDEGLDIRFNQRTGTMAIPPAGPERGLTYDITAAVPIEGDDLAVLAAEVAIAGPATGDQLSPPMRAFAADALEGQDPGVDQVIALKGRLELGFYDAQPGNWEGRSGHGLFRLTDFLDDADRVVGFEEQYAAAAALIARANDIPARVVVGYLIPDDELAERWESGTAEVLASHANAWLEVQFEELGWVPFDVTPDRTRQPEDQQTGVTEREVAVPNPPPPPPPPELPPRFEEEEEFEEDELGDDDPEADDGAGVPFKLIGTVLAASSPAVLLLGGSLGVAIWKGRRLRRRRTTGTPSRRVAGAWHEVLDRYQEAGITPPTQATPKEFARGLIHAEVVDEAASGPLLMLADRVDESVCHPDPASDDVAESAWEHSDEVVAALQADKSPLRRLISKIDPRPLMSRDPIAPDEVADE